MQHILPLILADRLSLSTETVTLLDVRTIEERNICHITKSLHIPMPLIPLQMNALPDEQDIIVYCHHGLRSQTVITYLLDAGFEYHHLFNLEGGIDRWATDIEPSMIRY